MGLIRVNATIRPFIRYSQPQAIPVPAASVRERRKNRPAPAVFGGSCYGAIQGSNFSCRGRVQPRPKLGRWTAELDELLEGNTTKPFREQLTLIRVFEELRGRGYDGGYDAVRRYARRWAKERGQSTAAAYVPLSFAPGEAYQFDWSHEVVLLSGVTVIVKAAHVRLCHSRMLFVRAYPRETQEMVFDAHDRAFALFKGACGRGIYDNMKTAVETIFVGKGRLYNRRFLQMCSHYLVDPVACTPASSWEKGQVENQVGLVRQRFFTPRLRFKNLDELNAWLLDKCIAYAKVHPHPELTEQTIGVRMDLDRTTDSTGRHRVLVVVEAYQAGLRDRCRHRVEAIEPAGVGNELRPLCLEHLPDRHARTRTMSPLTAIPCGPCSGIPSDPGKSP